jgi:MFS transporter, FSR family, fosmidomycin resistance protein
MARWELAGSAGSVAGPLVLVAVLAAGGGWRSAYLVLAAAATAAWLAVARNPPAPAGPGEAADAADAAAAGAAAGARDALRTPGVARCLILLQVCDLLLDVLTGFLAVYLVDAGRATPTQAALGVAVRLGAGLAGDAALVWVIERIGALTLVRAGAAVAALAYPAFLIVPGIAAKLVVLGCLSIVTAPWYPVLLAELYDSLPGRSGAAVSLSSAAGLLGGAGPLAVGFAAQHLGLAWSMAGLAVVPAILLGGLWRWPPRDGAPLA